MGYNNGLVYAPVSIYDVQRALGVSSPDLGTLCTSGNINKWAKFKPVIRPKVGIVSLADRQSANFGIGNIPTWNNINKMATFWLLQDTSSSVNYPDCGLQTEYWTYNRPTGGGTAPYRLSDFSEYPVSASQLGYYHGAEQPLGPVEDLNLKITCNGQLVIVWPVGAIDDRTLKLSDLFYYGGSQISLSGFYFTAILARVGATGTKYVMTDENQTAAEALEYGAHCRPWFQSASDVYSFMGGQSVTTAQFYLMCCMCNEEIYDTFTSGSTTYRKFKTSLGSLTADKFLALFERQTVTITKESAGFPVSYIRATRIRNSGNRLINYVFTISNNDSVNRRFYYITVEVRDSRQNVLAAKIYNTASDYIDGGDTKTISDSVDGGQYYLSAATVVVTTAINPSRDSAMITETHTASATVEVIIDPTPDA